MKLFLLIVFLVFSLNSILGGVLRSFVNDCSNDSCPEGTAACKKHIYISNDRQHLETDISCLDEQGNVLKNFTQQKPNPFDANVHFEGYRYSGSFILGNKKEPQDSDKTGDSNDVNVEIK